MQPARALSASPLLHTALPQHFVNEFVPGAPSTVPSTMVCSRKGLWAITSSVVHMCAQLFSSMMHDLTPFTYRHPVVVLGLEKVSLVMQTKPLQLFLVAMATPVFKTKS